MDVGQRDSGLECLTLLLRFHQIAIDPAQIAHQFAGERIGTAQMLCCATRLKVKARAISETWGGLKKLPLPAIVERKDGTCVILGQVAEDGALIGRSLDDTSRQRRPPTMIGDHGRVRPVRLHTTKTQSRLCHLPGFIVDAFGIALRYGFIFVISLRLGRFTLLVRL